jgi:hypothetical protein
MWCYIVEALVFLEKPHEEIGKQAGAAPPVCFLVTLL